MARDNMDAMFKAIDIAIDRCIKYGLTDEQIQICLDAVWNLYMGDEMRELDDNATIENSYE